MDDFYQLHSQKMVLLETTNDIFDKSLYKLVTGESLLAWQRVRLASLLANNGEEWATIVAKYNSGTCQYVNYLHLHCTVCGVLIM